MHLEVLVEELSAQVALETLLPAILRDVSLQIHPFQGKLDLLAKLPNRLKAYRSWLPEDWVIVVLVDRDLDDCHELKAQLEQLSIDAGFASAGQAPRGQRFRVLNRIAIEELEAWFLGDPAALRVVYPRLSKTFHQSARLRNPDSIAGGTWEALERLLQRAGYYPGGLPKTEVARLVAPKMTVSDNRSRSFQVFRDGLLRL